MTDAKAESPAATNTAREAFDEKSDNVSAVMLVQTEAPDSSCIIPLLWEQKNLTAIQIAELASCLNVGLLLPHIIDLNGQELITATRNIQLVGKYQNNSAHYELSLSPLSISVLLNYALKFLPDNVRRSIIAVWKSMLPADDRNVEALAGIFGCSKNTLYAGIDDIMQSGLVLSVEDPNKSGAGRPQTNASFAEAVTPVCIGAGIDQEKLIKRHEMNLAGLTVSEQKSENSEEPSEVIPNNYSQPENEDGNDVSDEENEKEKADPVTVENVVERFHTVQTNTDIFIKALEAEKSRKGFGDIMLYHNLLKEVAAQRDKLVTVFSDLEENSAEAVPTEEQEDENAPFLKELRNSAILSHMVPLVQTLENLLNAALGVLAKNDTLSPYSIGKEMRRVVRLKRFSRTTTEYWDQYQLVLNCIEDVKKDPSIMKTVKEIELPERPAHLEEHYQDTEKLLNELRQCLAEDLENDSNKTVAPALSFLNELQKRMEAAYTSECTSENKRILYTVSNIIETVRIACQEWLNFWNSGHKNHSAVTAVSRKMLSSGFQDTYKRIFNELETVHQAVRAAKETEESAKHQSEKAVNGAEQNNHGSLESCESELKTALEEYQSLRDLWTVLKKNLEQGSQKMKSKKNSNNEDDKQHIQQAIQVLNGIMAHFEGGVPKTGNCSAEGVDAFRKTVRQFADIFEKWLSKWEKKDNEYKPSVSISRQVSNSVLSSRHTNLFKKIWDFYERSSHEDTSWADNSQTPTAYVLIESHPNETFINYTAPEQRAALALKLWNEGKDPLDITAWIDLIIGTEYKKHYCEPDGETKCCRITKLELKEAFFLLTGLEYSETTLWRILTSDMGYSGRQCAKLDQIGERDPHADEQYNYIQQQMKAVDKKTTLVLSIDTKAFIVLGRLKHDNGVLMCSSNGKVFKVYDHDFPMFMNEIYPDGTSLVGSERLKERAVLHPVGVYCPFDNTGYVALVLGKDTAESMANLIRTVINIKRESMPDLKEVLIMADGGGANMANGILWTQALLSLTEKTGIAARIMHFPAGNSRHNPIERALWSYCTMHCKGKPFLDIEHVVRLFNETTTRTTNPLRVTCWFDKKKYKTLTEKKADGESVLTRAELDTMAKGRIYHPFDDSTNMYKWNYTIYPPVKRANVDLSAAS